MKCWPYVEPGFRELVVRKNSEMSSFFDSTQSTLGYLFGNDGDPSIFTNLLQVGKRV